MNTLAFLPLSGDKEKSFEILTAGANVTKLFFFIKDQEAK
jgi:hypothetical protein